MEARVKRNTRKKTAVDERVSSGGASAGARPGAPQPEDVAIRAYRIYVESGYVEGRDLDNWLEAERQLEQEVSTPDLHAPGDTL